MSGVKTRIACQEFRERLQLYTRILQDDGQGGQETIDNRCIGEVWGYVHRPHFTVLDTGTGEGQVITQGFTIRDTPVVQVPVYFLIYRTQAYEVLHMDQSQKGYITFTTKAVIRYR